MPERSIALVASLAGPWGPIHAAATERGVVAIAMLATPDAFAADLSRIAEPVSGSNRRGTARDHLDQLTAEFTAYFGGDRRPFSVPLDLLAGSAWDRLVLGGVRAIPFGEVQSYGEVARRIGRFGAARAVGGAVGRNPLAILIPCHRVIAAGGALGGYGGDWYGSRQERLAMKRDLLRLEGVVLRDDPLAVGAERRRFESRPFEVA